MKTWQLLATFVVIISVSSLLAYTVSEIYLVFYPLGGIFLGAFLTRMVKW